MTPDDRREAEYQELLKQFGVTLAEYVVLHLMYYEERPLELVVPYARGLWHANGHPLEPRKVYDLALTSLLDRALVQVIDDDALHSIITLLESDPALGPTEGLPLIGTVAFTLEGLALWREMQCRRDILTGYPQGRTGCLAAPVYDGNRCEIYCMSVYHAVDFARTQNAYHVSMPVPIGPWRCQWWDKYPFGFRVDCEFPASEDEVK